MPLAPRVLVALRDPEARNAFSRVMPTPAIEPVFASSVGETRRILQRESIALVICEDQLGDGSFREVLRDAAMQRGPVPVVVASHMDDQAEYLEAMGLGAFDFIAAPYRRAEVRWIIEHALVSAPSPGR